MFVPRETRNKFNTLSKEVWGASSRWMQYLEKGMKHPSTTVHKRTGLPASSAVTYHTLDSLYALMLDLKKQMDDSRVKKI